MEYKIIKYYEKDFNRLVKFKNTFELSITTYTRKIKTDRDTIIYNDSGSQDFKIMQLIRKVRNDAKDFIYPVTVKNIDFCYLYEKIKDDEIISKIDIRSAYWNYALKCGLISQKTDDFFKESFENEKNSYSKGARLKALGSLATKKTIIKYEKGIQSEITTKEEDTKMAYMFVCKGIDRLMKDIRDHNNGVVFYYWDCVFVKKGTELDIIEFIKNRGYDCSVEETMISLVNISGNKYLLSESDDKMYLINKQNKL